MGPLGHNLRPARLYSSAAEVTDEVCNWLDAVDGPFFAWAHYMDVHWPYYLEETLTRPAEIAQAWQDLGIMAGRSNYVRTKSISTAQRSHFVELYERSLQYLDTQIGRLMNHLDQVGHGSNTVVIVVADHGEEFLEHERWGHWESNLFDEILKVPLIFRIPDKPGDRVIRSQVRLLDLMPTILDLCGCPEPAGMMGTSMTPLWNEQDAGL